MQDVLDTLGGRSRELLVRSCEAFEPGPQATALRAHLLGRPRPLSASRGTSRQAGHALLCRALTTAVSGAWLLAHRDLAYRRFLLSREFARLKPYRPDTYAKFEQLVSLERPRPASDWRPMFDAGARVFIQIGRAPHLAPLELRLVASSAFITMGAALVAVGERLRPAWRAAWRRADRLGALEHPFFRMNLALLGSFADEWEPHVDWLMGEQNWQLEVADLVCFVREDLSAHLHASVGCCVGDEVHSPLDCLCPSNPFGSVLRVFAYARTAMRRGRHFHTPGAVLGVLGWANAAIELFEGLRARVARTAPLQPQALTRVETELRSLRWALRAEKARFAAAFEGAGGPRVRRRLRQLWRRIQDTSVE